MNKSTSHRKKFLKKIFNILHLMIRIKVYLRKNQVRKIQITINSGTIHWISINQTLINQLYRPVQVLIKQITHNK
jgi:hypothetical protein